MAFDKAPTSNYWSTTLNGTINNSVGTITLTSASGLQAPGYIVINRENGSGTATPNSREIVKFTGISSNDLTGCTRGADSSTARSHADGSLVEAVLTVGMWGDNYTALTAEHDTAGLHSIIANATITSLRAGSVVGGTGIFSGATLTGVSNVASLLAANATITTLTLSGGASVAPTAEGSINWRSGDDSLVVGDGAASVFANMGAWAAYTPSLTNITLGNGTLDFAWSRIGKTIQVRGRFLFGSTSSISGKLTFSLPVTAKTISVFPLWPCYIEDAGTATFVGFMQMASTTTLELKSGNAGGATLVPTDSSSTSPMTWATNDQIGFYMTYEAA